MSDRMRSILSFALAGLVVVGAFAALLLGRVTWDQCLFGVAFAFAGVGLYHARAPGQPTPVAPLLAMVLALAACDYEAHWSIGSAVRAGQSIQAPVPIQADRIIITPQSPGGITCPIGKACLGASSTSGRLYAIDSTGTGLNFGDARGFRVLSSAPGSPAAGDVYYDSSLGTFRFYTNAWGTIPVDGLVAHLAGVEIFTGAKTVNANWTTTDNTYILGDATHRWQSMGLIKIASGDATAVTEAGVADGGSAIAHKVNNTVALSTSGARLASWQNNGVEKAALLHDGAFIGPTVGPSASQQHTLPAVTSSTLAVLGAAQTWAQAQTFSAAPVINANPSGSFIIQKANGGTGEDNSTGGTANTFWGRPNGATGAAAYRALVAADLVGSGAPVVTITGGAATAIAAGGTGYLVAPGIAAASATPARLALLTRASTVRNLYCVADTLPGGAETLTCAVRRIVTGSGALTNTGVTCAIGGTGLCNDTSNSQANVAGTALVIECVQSAGSVAAGVTCSFEVTL